MTSRAIRIKNGGDDRPLGQYEPISESFFNFSDARELIVDAVKSDVTDTSVYYSLQPIRLRTAGQQS